MTGIQIMDGIEFIVGLAIGYGIYQIQLLVQERRAKKRVSLKVIRTHWDSRAMTLDVLFSDETTIVYTKYFTGWTDTNGKWQTQEIEDKLNQMTADCIMAKEKEQ